LAATASAPTTETAQQQWRRLQQLEREEREARAIAAQRRSLTRQSLHELQQQSGGAGAGSMQSDSYAQSVSTHQSSHQLQQNGSLSNAGLDSSVIDRDGGNGIGVAERMQQHRLGVHLATNRPEPQQPEQQPQSHEQEPSQAALSKKRIVKNLLAEQYNV
jgi:hypothetical protein